MSQDCATALQPGDRAKLHLKKKKSHFFSYIKYSPSFSSKAKRLGLIKVKTDSKSYKINLLRNKPTIEGCKILDILDVWITDVVELR